jgi:hypothetical protein
MSFLELRNKKVIYSRSVIHLTHDAAVDGKPYSESRCEARGIEVATANWVSVL